MEIYTKKEAKEACRLILENEDYSKPIKGYDHESAGYWKEEPGRWVAYDNTTGDCWMEEFKTRKEAIAYISQITL